MDEAPVHVTDLGRGDPVVLVHGSYEWGARTWREQLPLAEEFRLRMVDRRGFGRSPAEGRVDFARDARDLERLLDEPAHLVGHSYGGLVCLLAAAAKPGCVRSLTVIEPPALSLVRGRPEVEELIARVDSGRAAARDPTAAAVGFRVAFGYPPPKEESQLTGEELAAARSSADERLPQEAVIPLETLRRVGIRSLVVRGTWSEAPAEARRVTAAAFHAACDVIEAELGSERAVFEAAHSPQALGAPFNEYLRAFLRGR